MGQTDAAAARKKCCLRQKYVQCGTFTLFNATLMPQLNNFASAEEAKLYGLLLTEFSSQFFPIE